MFSNDKPVWFVCKDPGGTNGVLPVHDHLMGEKWATLLIPNGKAVELLQSRGLKTYASAEAALADNPPPAALVTSMCSEGGVGRELVPLLRGRCPTVALQDFWGSTLWKEWSDPKYRPDYIVVNDRVGAEIVQDAWPEFPTDHIKVLGYPASDKYAGVDTVTTRQSVKERLGITDDLPLVLYASQLAGSATTLRELCEALNHLKVMGKSKVHLIPRLHPRMRNNAPQEFKALNQALQPFAHGYVWPFTEICETAELISAADVVVGEWTTALVDAAAVRCNAIAVLYSGEGMARYLNSTGGNINEFPLVRLGCAAKAENRSELEEMLSDAVSGQLAERLRRNQEKNFKLDGQNTARVAEFVKSLL
ncbi:MAG: CDP-glycerol glycerophosphotransferase family protein [bacterium]|nr:CDP-glycerol glycerophosphotransferase family protein [bacterium]